MARRTSHWNPSAFVSSVSSLKIGEAHHLPQTANEEEVGRMWLPVISRYRGAYSPRCEFGRQRQKEHEPTVRVVST